MAAPARTPSPPSADPGPPPSPGIDRGLVVLLAVACGAAVANLYYAQPLLDTIAHDFGVSDGAAGLLVTASQIGYAAGLLFLVPLGDLLHRRRLVGRLFVVSALGLAGAAVAGTLALLAVAIAVAAVTSVAAQVLVPFSAELAAEEERGRVVGTVMSGLLIGILAARTVSGLIAAAGGWRLVYAVAAGLMLVLAVALTRALPDRPPPATLPYRRLLTSVGSLVRHEGTLRLRMLYGMCGMASFTVMWTSLAFLLAGPPYDYGDAVIGLFGLAGLVGAGSAQFSGRLADRGLTGVATGAFLLAVVGGWVFLAAAGRHSVAAIIAGIVLVDLGLQGQHILNQSTIYALRPDARGRLTTAYMGGNFLAGAVASAAAAAAWSAGGWSEVSVIGLAVSGFAFAVWLLAHVVGRRG